jgi:hypothetical protein
VTVWVKRMDVAGAQYVDVENVNLEQTVSKFKARWVAQAKLDVDPSLVTLRLVKCGAHKPSAVEEKQAVEIDPFDTLAVAGVSDNCKLLAYVAGAVSGQRVACLCVLCFLTFGCRHIGFPCCVATSCCCRG